VRDTFVTLVHTFVTLVHYLCNTSGTAPSMRRSRRSSLQKQSSASSSWPGNTLTEWDHCHDL
jgi:hypothetical protein